MRAITKYSTNRNSVSRQKYTNRHSKMLLLVVIVFFMVSTNFGLMIPLFPPNTAAGPVIDGTNLEYTAIWNLNTLDDLSLNNLTHENNSLKLLLNNDLKQFSQSSDFLSGTFNGTILNDNSQVALGYITNSRFTSDSGWEFINSSNDKVLSYYDSGQQAGMLNHNKPLMLTYKDFDFLNGVGTGSGTLMSDVLTSDDSYYVVDKNENITVMNIDITGMVGTIFSITIFIEYQTTKVFTGTNPIQIWDTSQNKYTPLNITPSGVDPSQVDIIRSDTLNASLLSCYDTWSELSNIKLYYENNAIQAAKNIKVDRVWINVSSSVNSTMGPPDDYSRMNYTILKTYDSPSSSGEIVLTYNYSVQASQNIIDSRYKVFLDGIELRNQGVPSAGTEEEISIDLSSYLTSAGTYDLSFQLHMNYSTYLPVTCSLKFNEVMVGNRNGTYLSEVYDSGFISNWISIAWTEINSLIGDEVQISVRSGNITLISDPSWSPWSILYTNPAGNILDLPPSRYFQYQLIFHTDDVSIIPALQDLILQNSYYCSTGYVVTDDFQPSNLIGWGIFKANFSTDGGSVNFKYSIDSGGIWIPIPANGSLGLVPTGDSKIRFRADITTPLTTSTPILLDFSISYFTSNHLPTLPAMLYPLSETFVASTMPIFNWEPSSDLDAGDSVTYTIYYTTDPLFSQDVTEVSGLHTTFYTPTIPLQDDTIFYWRVLSFDSHGAQCNNSASRSNVFIVNSRNDPPFVPQLLFPENETLFESKGIDFDWTDVTDPDFGDNIANFTLEYSTEEDFISNTTRISGITTTSFSLNNILENTKFYWHVEAVDSNGLSSGFQPEPNSFIVDIEYPRIEPMINDIIIGEDFPFSLDLMYHIEERFHSNNISWNLINVDTKLYNWEIENDNVLLISPVANSFGEDEFTIELYDSGILRYSQIASITIQSINDPPTIFPEVPDELFDTDQGKTLSINLDNFARDIEDSLDDLYWTVEGIDSDLYSVTIEKNPDILIIDPMLNNFGSDILILKLWDSDGSFAKQNVMVNITPIREPPVFSDLPDIVVHYSENYLFDLSPYISDPDTPMDELSISDNNEFVGFNPTVPYVAIFKFPASYLGDTLNVRFTVSDGKFSIFENMTVYVTDNNVPQKKEISDLYFDEDTSLNHALDLDNYFYDIDGDSISYFVYDNINININIRIDNGIDLSASPNWFGMETVRIRALDSRGAIAEDVVNIFVNPVNDPPEVNLGNLEIREEVNVLMDLSPYISDIDTPLNDLTIREDSEYIQVQDFNLSFYYHDGVSFDIFTLSVHDGERFTNRTIQVIIHPNQAPVIGEIPDLILHYDYDYKFNLEPYIDDPDNGSEDLNLITDSEYIYLDPYVPLMVVINFPQKYLGSNVMIKIDVSDGMLSSIGYFNVKISDDWAPELTTPLPNLIFEEDSSNLNVINLNDFFSDKDDDKLTFTTNSNFIEIYGHDNGYIDVSAEANWYGSEFVTIRALDQYGAFSEDTIRIDFQPINDAPEISEISMQIGMPNEIWSLDIKSYISDIDTDDDELMIFTNSKYIDVSRFTLFINYPANITSAEVLITVSDGELTTTETIVLEFKDVETVSESSGFSYYLLLGVILILITIFVVFIYFRKPRRSKSEQAGSKGKDVKATPVPVPVPVEKRIGAGRYTPDADYHEEYSAGPSMYSKIHNMFRGNFRDGLITKDEDRDGGMTPSGMGGSTGINAVTAGNVPFPQPNGLPSPNLTTIVLGHSYLVEELKPEATFQIFNSLVKRGLDGLCIARTHPDIIRNKYNVTDQPIIWLTSGKQVKNESYIPPPSLSRISLVVSNFIQKKHRGVIVLEGIEFLLNRDDFKTVLKLIHFLNDLVITNNSVLLLPLDPMILNESDLHMLERDCYILSKKNPYVISKDIMRAK